MKNTVKLIPMVLGGLYRFQLRFVKSGTRMAILVDYDADRYALFDLTSGQLLVLLAQDPERFCFIAKERFPVRRGQAIDTQEKIWMRMQLNFYEENWDVSLFSGFARTVLAP